jgi:hypothetical protein
LRCQVHTELAKCEEDVEQIEVAMTNLKKVRKTLMHVLIVIRKQKRENFYSNAVESLKLS